MATESLRSKRFAVSTFARLLVALAIVGALTTVAPSQSNSATTPPKLRSFWISSSAGKVTINNVVKKAKIVVKCQKGCKGTEKLKVKKSKKLNSKLLTKALGARRAAKLRVQETKPGFNGVWKIVTISKNGKLRSLPSPISVYCLAPRTKACGVKKTATPAATTATTPTATTPSMTPANTALPAISGTAMESLILTASQGSWSNSPTLFAYQWQRCDSAGSNCANLAGATTDSYALVRDDIGSTIRFAVTATNPYGHASATSAQTAVVLTASPINTAVPTFTGTASQGQQLTASQGAWNNSPTTYAYQWQRCDTSGSSCTNISSATSNKYTLQYAEAGFTVRVVVTATNSFGSGSAASARTSEVVGQGPANTGDKPVVTGTTKDSSQLTALDGDWSNSPTSFAYHWQRCNSSGTGCEDRGTNSKNYTLVHDDIGWYIYVTVSATNRWGTGTATSARSGIVTPSNTAPPAITGTLRDTQTLYASTGTWIGAGDLSISYKWQHCSSGSTLGTGTSYTLQSSDVSSSMQVIVTATKNGASAEATSSCTTATVAAAIVPSYSSGLTINIVSGIYLGVTDVGIWGGDPASSTSYRWYGSNWVSGGMGGGVCASTYPGTATWTLVGTGSTQSDVSYPCWALVMTKSNSGGTSGDVYSNVKQTAS